MTKAKTSRPKATTKSHAVTKRKPASKAKARSAAVTAKRKGIRHHAKHLYHATPKFIHGMIVGGIVGVLVVGFLGGSAFHPDSASASIWGLNNCTVKTGADNTFKVTGSTVSATFTVAGNCSAQDVSLTTWKAPNGDKGQPYAQQTLFAHTTGRFAPGTHTLKTTLPNCYYQVDLITGSSPTGTNGAPDFAKDGRLRRSLHGGTKSCTTTTTTTTTPTPLPKTPVVEAASVSTLPDTGPAALFIVLGLAVVGGYVFHMTHHHVKKRKHAARHHAAH